MAITKRKAPERPSQRNRRTEFCIPHQCRCLRVLRHQPGQIVDLLSGVEAKVLVERRSRMACDRYPAPYPCFDAAAWCIAAWRDDAVAREQCFGKNGQVANIAVQDHPERMRIARRFLYPHRGQRGAIGGQGRAEAKAVDEVGSLLFKGVNVDAAVPKLVKKLSRGCVRSKLLETVMEAIWNGRGPANRYTFGHTLVHARAPRLSPLAYRRMKEGKKVKTDG